MFFNEAGEIAYGTVFGYVWPQFLIALLAGVLIFFLGRRRVHRMYGAK